MATSLKTIDGNIALVRKNGDALNNLIHETAMMILHHAAPKDKGGEGHGDCSRAQFLVMAMPASMRRTSLIAWFEKYSPVVVKNSTDWNAQLQPKVFNTGKANPLYRDWNLEGANNEPFWQIANAQREIAPPKSFDDLISQVQNMTRRIEREINENRVKPEDLESARAMLKTLESLHFTKVKAKATSEVANDFEEINELRQQYTDVFAKRPYHGWTAEELRAKLAEHASQNAENPERAAA